MNNFQQQQAMMMGQPMQQQGVPPQQNLRTKLLNYFQNNQQHAGWQATVQPIERVGLVSELVTSLQLAQPSLSQQEAVKRSMTFESERLSQSADKSQYSNEIRKQLQLFRTTREAQAQNTMNMMQMNNQNGLQPGMNGGASMQQSMSNQGNQFPQAFNPQLAHPMQASPIPMNGQNPAMAMMGNVNAQAQMLQQQQQANAQQNQQQQQQQQRPQQGNVQLTQQDMANINMLAQRQMAAAPQEIKNKILTQFNSLDPQKQAAVRAKFGDPVAAHFRQTAHQGYSRQKQANMQSQNGQNGMANGMMGQQTPQQRPQQMANSQPGATMQGQDSNLLQQQQDAMNRATNGEPVVPASNNMNQFGGLPMGLAQNAQLGGAQGLNFQSQQQMLQQRQANSNFQLNPQASAQMQARIAQAQAQAQLRARQQAQQQANQGQQGVQQNQQMNGQRPMGAQPQQSPMPLLTQPVITPGQQAAGTPQQRPQPTPQMPQQNGPGEMFQAMQSAQNRANALGGTNPLVGQNQPIRRILPPDLPATMPENIKLQLQTMDDEHYKQAIERIRTHKLQVPMGNGLPGRQPGLGQPGMPGQPGQMTPLQFQQQRAAAAQAQNQMQQQPNGQFPGMTAEIMARMDQQPFPRSVLRANNINAPDHISTWMALKQWINTNPSAAPNINVKQLMQLQVSQFQNERQNAMRRQALQQQQQQQNTGAQIAGQQPPFGMSPAQPAPTAPMVPNGMTPQQQQQARMGMNGMMPGMGGMQRPTFPQPSAEELQNLRIKANVAPSVTDEELRQRVMQQRISVFQRQSQARVAAQQQALQRGGQQGIQGQIGGQQNQMPQMPQVPQRQPQPNQQQNQTPQMNAQLQQNRQNQRPGQIPAGSATPQPQANKLKRPAPQDEIIDITDTPQAAAMQQSRSQQQQRPQNNQAMQPRPQAAQAGQPPQKQHQEKRMAEMMAEVQASTPRPQAVQVTQETRQMMISKIQEFKQFIARIDQCIKMFFVMTNDEEHTKRYMKQRILLSYNFNFKDPNLALVDQPSLNLETLEQFLVSFRTVVASVMQKVRQNAIGQQGQNGAQQQAGQNGQASSPAINGQKGFQPTQLNANNLKQQQAALQQQQQQNAQQQRRASNKANQVPPAPIAGPGQGPVQFPFNNTAASPQGVPRYGDGAAQLTPDKLKIQPRKKIKTSPVSTPTGVTPGASASPQLGNKGTSPDLRRQAMAEIAKPEMQKPPQFRCPDRYCQNHEKGFETEEQLKEHSKVHQPPADSLKYANEVFAVALGFNADGSARQTAAETAQAKHQQTQGKSLAAPMKKEVTTPLASTPMSRAPTLTKGSPALDRLKNPLHKQHAAPTSAATVEKKDEKAPEMPAVSAPDIIAMGELVDPWADATIRPKELQDLFGPFDTLTGDWGFDRTFDTPDTPATTPDTNISKDTVSTDISENDNLNILLGGVAEAAMGNTGKNSSDDFVAWHEIQDHWQSVMDGDLAENMGAVGIDEGLILRLDEDTDVNDWEGMFGKGSNLGGNQVPGWEQEDIPMF